MSEVRRRQQAERADERMLLTEEETNISGDEYNIAILLILYLLQGIPLGLAAAIPMILQSKGASFKQQAEFSFVNWPFSLKLLWAPLVDSLYSPRFGRRKTWLVPVQYLISLFMILLSFKVESWLGIGSESEEPRVALLTFVFFLLNFLAATQDIAVDGWALTMLKRRNVGYASTCNSVGQTAGYFLGFVIFIALESPEFCNNYLRSEPHPEGMVSLPGFLYFWGIVYTCVTTLVALFKHEAPERDAHLQARHPLQATVSSYKQLVNILLLPSVRTLALVLLTAKIGYAATDAVSSLKLIERGIPKDKMALMAVPLVPLQIALPVILAKYHSTARPLNMFIKVIPYRLGFNLIAALFVFITPFIVYGEGIPVYYYVILLLITSLHQVTIYCMFVELMTFFAKISDPLVGGTNMTLLNTLNNLGGTLWSTVALWFVDLLTTKSCSNDSSNQCSNVTESGSCTEGGGTCITTFDGYYLETIILTAVGILWYFKCKKILVYLQSRPLSAWHSR